MTDIVFRVLEVKGSPVWPPEHVETLRRRGGPRQLSPCVPLSEYVTKPVRLCVSWINSNHKPLATHGKLRELRARREHGTVVQAWEWESSPSWFLRPGGHVALFTGPLMTVQSPCLVPASLSSLCREGVTSLLPGGVVKAAGGPASGPLWECGTSPGPRAFAVSAAPCSTPHAAE